jgi:hypothetical protein
VLADEGVQQRRFADVGTAGEDDGAAAGHAKKATASRGNVKNARTARLADRPSDD